MHSNSIPNVNVSSSFPECADKGSEDYAIPDSIKNMFAEAGVNLEKVISDEEVPNPQAHQDLNSNKKSLLLPANDDDNDVSICANNEYQIDISRVPFFSPASDMNASYDLDLGSACRPNPADLYATTAEAMHQALDDQPGVCPDHEDNCKCRLVSFPQFNLEVALEELKVDCKSVQKQEMERTPRNDAEIEEQERIEELKEEENNDPKGAKVESDSGKGQEEEDGQDSVADEDDFLPDESADVLQVVQQYSQDTDLSLDDELDDSFESHSDEEGEDIDEFLPNNNRSSLGNILAATKTIGKVKNASAKSKILDRRVKKPQDDTKTKNMGRNRNKGREPSEPLAEDKAKFRRFNMSFPRSPRLRSKRARQYASLEYPNDNNRNDVPLKIEWSKRKPSPEPKSRVSAKGSTSINSAGKERRRRRLTVPRMPNLLNREKKGDRKYSTVGLRQKKKSDIMTQSLLENEKLSVTAPNELIPTQKSFVKKPLTEPVSPNLVMNKKFGKRRYSLSTNGTVGTKQGSILIDVKPKVDWAKRKPTVPKTPMLSFFIQEPKKRDEMKEVNEKQARAPFVFKARPAPNFSNPTLHKSKMSVRPLTIPKPFHLATNERALSSPRESSPMCRHAGNTVAVNDKEVKPSSFVFRARPVPDFSQPSIPTRKAAARPLTITKPFHLTTDDRDNSSRSSKRSVIMAEGMNEDKFEKDTVEKKRRGSSCMFKARLVPDFSKLVIPQQKTSMRPLTVPKPFHLTKSERALAPRRSKESFPANRIDSVTENIIVEDTFVFRARAMPIFSRNPNNHRKALSKRALTVPVPFRLVTRDRANTPRRQSIASTINAAEIPVYSPTSKRTLTFPKPFHLLTQKRAIRKPHTKGELDLPLPPPETLRSYKVGDLMAPRPFRLRTTERANGSQAKISRDKILQESKKGESSARREITIPRPFHLTSSKRKESEGSNSKDKGALGFRARPMPSYKTSRQQPSTLKRSLTTPKPFRLRTEERANFDDHRDLLDKLNFRSKQNAVARAEQFDETQNTVDRLVKMSPIFLSADNGKQCS